MWACLGGHSLFSLPQWGIRLPTWLLKNQMTQKWEGAGSPRSEIQPMGRSRQNEPRKRHFFPLCMTALRRAVPSATSAETSHMATHTLSSWPGLSVAHQEAVWRGNTTSSASLPHSRCPGTGLPQTPKHRPLLLVLAPFSGDSRLGWPRN